jgi:hypothetical protein
MMQVLKKVFMENVENGDRPHFHRILFWNIIRRFPILLVNGKERAIVPSLKKVACPLFYPILPRAHRLPDLTKIRG